MYVLAEDMVLAEYTSTLKREMGQKTKVIEELFISSSLLLLATYAIVLGQI